MVEEKYTAWLEIAKKAALMAGDFLLQSQETTKDIRIESTRDIKINADIQSEEIIISHLKSQSDFSIISEEAGFLKGGDSESSWIIDPLDGSLNYLRGVPICCVSIGLWQGDIPVLGVVYDFNRQELFSGISNKKAWVNDQILKVSNTTQKEKAILCTGFPINTDFSSEGLLNFVNNIRSYKKVRLLGSAALSIAYVASGRTDVYEEKDIMIWDVAGAIPILLGAGGKIKKDKTSKSNSFHVIASNIAY